MLLFLFLPSFLGFVRSFPTEDIFRGSFEIQPPHCSRTPFVLGHISSVSAADIVKTMQLQFYIGLHTTVCFRLNEDDHHPDDPKSSWLHTLRLDRLEHHHPVVQHYEFGIPEYRADCFCECDGSADNCNSATHQFTTCPTDSSSESCYRTFFPNQAPDGCPAGSNPKMCCDLKFTPYRNQTYMAVKVEQPSTYATFVYSAFDYAQSRWQIKDRSTIRLQLDGGTQDKFLDRLKRITLAVTAGGRASHQLESGMYFANSNPGGEMGELRKQPLNEFAENNFDRLGWYRRQNDRFVVNNGAVKMQDIHKAKVKNCKEQTFQGVLSARNYLPGDFNLTRPLEMLYPWIQSAKIYDGTNRQVIVTHAEGTNLHLTLQVAGDEDGHQLMFIHNESKIAGFTGSIVVDSKSNRYFNVTVFGASGKINGVVKYSTQVDSDDIFSFSAYVHDLQAANQSMIVQLPAVVEAGSRMICIRADEEREDQSVCNLVPYHEVPLEIDLDQNTWHEQVGHCPSCNSNHYSFESLTRFLNPQHWINGITSIGPDTLNMITMLVVYLIALFIIFKIVTTFLTCFTCATKTTEFITSCIPSPKSTETSPRRPKTSKKDADEDEGVYV